jgi:IMP cyclohydrolase
MYVGRIVAIGKNRDNRLVIMYRVSARSFPNRRSKKSDSTITILPKQGFEDDISKNPYIVYNALRVTDRYAVVGNGTHTDPITERINSGMRKLDAMITVLYGMDYEHDDYNTPRIAAIIDRKDKTGTLGIIRYDALLVEDFDLEIGTVHYLATYRHDHLSYDFCDRSFDATEVDEACDYILGKGVFADFELPITGACAIETDSGFICGSKDVKASSIPS